MEKKIVEGIMPKERKQWDDHYIVGSVTRPHEKNGGGGPESFHNADTFIREARKALYKNPDNGYYLSWDENMALRKALTEAEEAGRGNPGGMPLERYEIYFATGPRGTIHDHDTGEVVDYYNSDEYLAAFREKLEEKPGRFSFQTYTDSLATWKAVDDAIRDRFGIISRNEFEENAARKPVTEMRTIRSYSEEVMPYMVPEIDRVLPSMRQQEDKVIPPNDKERKAVGKCSVLKKLEKNKKVSELKKGWRILDTGLRPVQWVR